MKHQQLDVDKIYLYVKYSSKPKYQLLIKERDKLGIKKLKNSKAFIDCSQIIDDATEILEDYNSTKKTKELIVFDDMIGDKTIRLNATHYFFMIIPNKSELHQTASKGLSDIEFKDFMKLFKDYTKELFSFLVTHATLTIHQIIH